MQETLIEQVQKAIECGLHRLREHDDENAQIEDLSAHYKAPYLYAVLGNPVRARHYVDLLRRRYLQADGDFRTTVTDKGWAHLRCSPENRYVYANGWIIVGLRKLGVYDIVQRGLDFIC